VKAYAGRLTVSRHGAQSMGHTKR